MSFYKKSKRDLFISCFVGIVALLFHMELNAIPNRDNFIYQGNKSVETEIKPSNIIESISEVSSNNSSAKSFGVWVEAEGPNQPLNDVQELYKLKDFIKNNPVTDLYVQVYRNGKSWFPSKIADDTPYQKMRYKGVDPIRQIINAAKNKGSEVKVHFWFNALRLGNDNKNKVLTTLGREAVLVSSRGESLLDSLGEGNRGCRPDTPGIWLDPDNKNVSSLLLKLFVEAQANYPEINGLHLDMIRSPFPYAVNGEMVDSNCTAFLSPKKYNDLSNSRGLHDSQINITSDQAKISNIVTGPTIVVKKFQRILKRIYPEVELSAAVLSNQNKAIKYANQDWPKWIEDGLVDHVVTMNYTNDIERFKQESLKALEIGKNKVSIGIGAWLALDSVGNLENQVSFINDKEFKGVVLFSYGNLSNKRGERLYKSISKFYP